MSRRLTTEEFIAKARAKHGDKYDYSKVEYVNSVAKVCIICPIHGEFWQSPSDHLRPCDCFECGVENRKRMRFGVAINDEINSCTSCAYKIWNGMLNRCYNKKIHDKEPTYIECSICKDWLIFSNFKKWFYEHYVEGWHLDKDILVKGNKVYSPETCCFVPRIINAAMTGTIITNLSKGISEYNNLYVCRMGKDNTTVYLGAFKSKEEAMETLKREKEAYIHELAERYKDQLEPRVYEVMLNMEL